MKQTADWRGRFPRNEIISLLDVNRRYNLAESTAQDLTFSEILELAGGEAALGKLPMGYGSSAGLPRLRAVVAALTGVRPEEVVTTQGTALGLFLLAFELCRPGDEAVIATPCFPPARDTLLGAGVTLRECRLSFDRGYRLTADLIEPLLNDRTRLVSIASPQNPSGVRTPLAEIEAILDLMRRKAPGGAALRRRDLSRRDLRGRAAPTERREPRRGDHHRRVGVEGAWRTRASRRLADRPRRRPARASYDRQDECRGFRLSARRDPGRRRPGEPREDPRRAPRPAGGGGIDGRGLGGGAGRACRLGAAGWRRALLPAAEPGGVRFGRRRTLLGGPAGRWAAACRRRLVRRVLQTSCASASAICRSRSFHPHSRRFRRRCRRRRARN